MFYNLILKEEVIGDFMKVNSFTLCVVSTLSVGYKHIYMYFAGYRFEYFGRCRCKYLTRFRETRVPSSTNSPPAVYFPVNY